MADYCNQYCLQSVCSIFPFNEACRMDTHFLVTEYGVVNLKGKSTRERSSDVISIAHPRFRDELLKEAEINVYFRIWAEKGDNSAK